MNRIKSLEESELRLTVELQKMRAYIEEMEKAMQVIIGHSNCYCPECKQATIRYWKVK